jgi:hypothetical protein
MAREFVPGAPEGGWTGRRELSPFLLELFAFKL